MADRPIIFSAPMVQALLAGRKTQTRRILKPQPELNEAGLWRFPPMSHRITKRNWKGFCQTDDDGLRSFILTTRHAPYAPGDRLWVREAWRTWDALDGAPPVSMSLLETVHYEADGEVRWRPVKPAYQPGRLRPSIHMPRWASRITLHVSEVRVQRLQEISRGDAMDEGCPFPNMASGPDPREWFRDLWNSLHGEGAWASNPWVAAITFTVERANIDEARHA